jgi:sugar-specific transcriptional regulator TrmB
MEVDFNKITQALIEIGLTKNQATVYSYLSMYPKEKISRLSKLINLDRSNTYKTITQLQQKGLVNKIISRPSYYEAIPLKEGIQMLLNDKENAYKKAYKKAQILLKSVKLEKISAITPLEVKLEASNEQKAIALMKHIYPTVKESIDLIYNKKRFYQTYSENIRIAMKIIRRGVKIRMIIEKTDIMTLQKHLWILKNEPNIQIRLIDFTPKADLIIFDRKYARMSLISGAGIDQNNDLCSNYEGFVEMAQDYFDKTWNKAQEYNFTKYVKIKSNRKNIKSFPKRVNFTETYT